MCYIGELLIGVVVLFVSDMRIEFDRMVLWMILWVVVMVIIGLLSVMG